MSEITLQASNGKRFAIPTDCLAESKLLAAMDFSDSKKREVRLEGIPSLYLDFGTRYLKATCNQTATEELTELGSTRNVLGYPRLMLYVYGYLQIDSFAVFYQRMLLDAIRGGTISRAISEAAKLETLEQLNDKELYAVSEYVPKIVNSIYHLPNARRYLQAKLSRGLVALCDDIPFQVRAGGRLFIKNREIQTDNPVTKVYAARAGARTAYYYYIDETGQLFEGSIRDKFVQAARRISVPEKVKDCSTNAQTTLILTESGTVYGYGDNTLLQLGPGVTVYTEPRKVELEFACSQVLVGMDRSILLSEDGGVFIQGELGLTSVSCPVGVRQLGRDDEDGLVVLTDDLRVLRYAASGAQGQGQEIGSNVLSIEPAGLFIMSNLTLVDLTGLVVDRNVVAVATSEYHELHLTTTNYGRLFEYKGEDETWHREQLFRALR